MPIPQNNVTLVREDKNDKKGNIQQS